MKTKKWMKVVGVVMSCMVAVALCGCGSKTFTSGDDTLKIGGSGPVTGDYALYGLAVQHGAEVAVAEINASNPEVQVEFNMQDDEGDGEKAVNAYNLLKDGGMQIMVGTTTSGACAAMGAEAKKDGIFCLTPSASSVAVTEGNDTVFQLCFSDPNQGVAVADYIAENMPSAKVGVIYNNAQDYSVGIFDKFKSEFESKGKTILAVEAFSDDKNADFSSQLNSMKSAGVDMLFLPIYYTPAANIIQQANNMGYAPTYFGVDGMDGILNVDGFDTALAEGILLLTPFTAYSEDAEVKAFVKAYEEAYDETPIQFAADAYDAVYAAYYAFLGSGCQTTDDAATIGTALVEMFSDGYTYEGGLTGDVMSWNSKGEVNKTPKVVVIEDGKYIEK